MGQFSGAAWHPMCYAGDGVFDAAHVEKLAANHQTKTRDRFLRVSRSLGAKKWVPCSGPACFLEDDLFKYNAVDEDTQKNAIFPDAYQCNFPESKELCRVMPGDTFTSESLKDNPQDPIQDKLAYLNSRRVKTKRTVTASALQNAAARFAVRMNEILESFGDFLVVKIPLTLYIRVGSRGAYSHIFLLDFEGKTVKALEDSPTLVPPYYIVNVPSWLFVALMQEPCTDWEEAFLGQWCHFERSPDVYNPWILAFFKNLDLQRMRIMKREAERNRKEGQYFVRDGWKIPRFCPHQGVDLATHSDIEDGVITCLGHGMSWDLKTGKGVNNNLCLASCPIGEHPTCEDAAPEFVPQECECDLE